MKAVKMTALRPVPLSPLTLETFLKKTKTAGKTRSAGQDQRSEFIIIPTQNISSSQRVKLLPLGFPVRVREDLLQRLMQMEKENRHLKSLSVTDELTGLYNKRFFNRQLTVEIARTQRSGDPFCLVFIDLDNFKIVNDTLGHTKGDEFLVKISRQVIANIRPTDYACRFGGDEFAIILPATSLQDGIGIARRWHMLLLRVATGRRVPISSSIGVDEFDASCTLKGPEFLHRVDQLLYEAKKTGKGKIVHPKIGTHGRKTVRRAGKEILYPVFRPTMKKKQILQKDQEKKLRQTKT